MESLKDFMKNSLLENEESRKGNTEEIKKSIDDINKILKDSYTAIVLTNKGSIVIGSQVDIYSTLAAFVNDMIEKDMISKKDFEMILEVGSKPVGKVTKELLDALKNDEKVTETITKMESIIEKIEQIKEKLGD